MKKILINDGISKSGKQKLIEYNFNVIDQHIDQDNLIEFINDNNVDGILVRSATKITKEIINECPSLKLIGRGGVGMDNIDVQHAQAKKINVINTPGASSSSVGELVFSHLFSMARHTYHSNRTMPLEGDFNFKKLKKNYASGSELRNKTIGIIGFGKIGQAVAKIAIGIGMNVLFYDKNIKEQTISINFYNEKEVKFHLKRTDFEILLEKSDMISLHIPKQEKPLINKKEIKLMKKGVFIVNTSRGGIINEKDLIQSLNNRHIQCAGLDVFEKEPNPNIELLMNEHISLSPHIGASTLEAQQRIGLELAEQVNQIFNG
ncbi:MAG: 3-phosphoglycerate dehydrogenase [Flavobacteriales bacterium]|nr:3-phosphoglycerate dehydrogenase [Flavobacteriales bacterium]